MECERPVRALKSVVFPTFGLPMTATVLCTARALRERHERGFGLTQGEVVALDDDFHGVAERGHADDFDVRTFDHAHFKQALMHRAIARKQAYDCRIARFQLV